MRKITILLSTLAMVSMLLVACGAEETSTSVASTEVPSTMDATETMPATTEEPSGTETVVSTGEGIPVTGEDDPSRLSNELDYDVWNQDGEQIGEVNNMVVDLGDSRVSYVIVGTGGFLEIGERDVFVPWDSLELQTAQDDSVSEDHSAFVLTTDQKTFENAPDFDVNILLPPLGEVVDNWDANIRNYWENGVAPDTSSTGETSSDATATVSPDETNMSTMGTLQGVVLASELLDSAVTIGANGELMNDNSAMGTETPAITDNQLMTATPETTGDTLSTSTPGATEGLVGDMNQVTAATIDDVIVNIDTGEIEYIVLNASFDDGDRWIPIPLSHFQWDATNGSYVLDVDNSMFGGAPFFPEGQYPDTTLDGWDTEYSTYWQ